MAAAVGLIFAGTALNTGGVAVKEKPDPPPSWLDDAHPLASQYAQ